jgi:hypothetical protein
MTMTSTAMAASVRAVSFKLSPLAALLLLLEILMTSALSRLPAISKDVRVRVLGS